MIRISLLIFLFIAVFSKTSNSQSCPPNIDFELGNFSNWECFTGKTTAVNGKNEMTMSPSGPVSGRHEIISSSSPVQLDPYGKFPTLCPYGGNTSIKLGNESTGGDADGLSYTFTVPTAVDTFTFTYFYAVVFEEPGHALSEQPRFFVTAYDVATGKLINCASFDYVANGAIPGFEASALNSKILFKKWSPASLQFAGLGGRSVRLEFRTADCTLGGHFGYAYVDVGSGCSNILATAPYCKETNSLILNAPYGFKNYTWYNENFSAIVGNQQSLTLSPPPSTMGVFYVDVDPYPGFGCRDTLAATVMPLPVPKIPDGQTEYVYCQNSSAPPLTATASKGHDLLWYNTEFGGIESTIPPVPATKIPGTYTFFVSQKVLFGCESLRKKITVKIVPTPFTAFTINKARQCQNDNDFFMTSTTTNLSNSIFSWDFGNNVTLESGKDSIVNFTYASPGNFNIKLKVTNSATCFSEAFFPVTVVPKPLAAYNYPPVICEKQTPLQFVNTSSVPGGLASITSTWWSIGDSIITNRDPAVLAADNPGPLTIKLVVATAEGCKSDTNSTILNVRYRPGASFKLNSPLCNNETTRFTDLSSIASAGNDETIVKWNWQVDKTPGFLIQHPSVDLPAGIYHAILTTESNFGCKSTVADSIFEIKEKPATTLLINDSCVFRTINYQATDLHKTANTWFWNFGNGFVKNNSVVSKTYSTEGYRPLTVIAQSIYGCKDTLNRSFTIYDNKALAGKDTIAAMGEPVQLHAKGGPGVEYKWTPALGLDSATIEHPVATLDKEQLYRLDALTDKGCDSHSTIRIKRYVGPELYIPSAFTPNGDGVNDVLKVFPVGIKTFNFMAVFNRAGQKIFYTTNPREGWDGTINGNRLDTNTFVACSSAIDYKGNVLTKKTTVTILR